jgi:hypothetical protein
MKVFEELLGLRLIESLTESPDWESTWWDTVFRGLQEEFSAEQCPDSELPTAAAKRAPASTDSVN